MYIREGNVRVDPIKTSRVWVAAGIYFCAAGICGFGTVCPLIAAIIDIRKASFLLPGVIVAGVLISGPLTWLFLWMAILRLRGDPSFGFLHKSIRRSAAFNKFVQWVHNYGERIAVAFAAIASWITMGLIYRYGDMAFLIGWGTFWGPCTLLLTYFALGGDIPVKLRQKGFRRLTMIPIVFFISLFAFFVVVHFFPPNPN